MAIEESLGTAFVDVRASLDSLDRDLAQARTKVTATMNRIADDMGRLGRSLSMRLTAPIVGMGTAASRVAMNFETSFAQITGLVGIAADEVARMREAVLNLAPATGRGPQELAEALFFVTSAGARGQEALDILEMSAKGAAAGLGETKAVALTVVSAMNTWRKEGLSAAQATDVLVSAVREGNMEASDLASSISMVLGTAQNAGLTFADTAHAISVMTRQGLNANIAVTSLNALLMQIQNPGNEAREMLEIFGISAQDLQKTLREEGLIEALRQLAEGTGYSNDAMFKIIPNIRAVRAVFSILGQDVSTVNQIFDAGRNSAGKLTEAFNVSADTAQHKFNAAFSEMSATLIEIGESINTWLLPAIDKVKEVAKEVSDTFGEWDDETKEMAISIAALVAGIGPLLVVLATLIKSMSIILGVLIGAASAVGLLTTGIVALVAALGMVTWTAMRKGREEMDAILEAQNRILTGPGAQHQTDILGSAGGANINSRDFRMELLMQGATGDRSGTIGGDLAGVRTAPVVAPIEAPTTPTRTGPTLSPEQLAKIREDTDNLNRSLAELRRQNELLAGGASDIDLAFSDFIDSLNLADENAAKLEDTIGELREQFQLLADQQRAKEIIAEVATEQERFAAGTREAHELMEKGLLTLEQYQRKVAALRKELFGAKKATSDLDDAAKQLGFTFSSALEDAIVKFEDLGKVMMSVLEDILRIMTRLLITQPLANMLASSIGSFMGGMSDLSSGGFGDAFHGPTGSAQGNVFGGGRIIPFASGGIVQRPTLFGMSDGNTGKMGEQGTEAIMPLTRLPGGDLGVKSVGAGGVQVQVIDQRSKGAEPEVSDGFSPDGRRRIRVLIRDEVSGLMDGGALDGAMKRNFGTRRPGGTR